MNEFVNSIAEAMNNSLGAPLTVFLLSMIPIAEARFAIPFGMSMGLDPLVSFGYAFLGTSLITPILLLILIPIINALSKTRVFAKLGKFLYDKFEKKSHALDDKKSSDGASTEEQSHKSEHKPKLSKSDLKKMGGTALFVAVPIPLTGVWTGSAVASIVKIGFFKGLVSVVVGNAVACSIITLICFAFSDYVNYITLAFFIIAVVVVIVLIIKLIVFKPKTAENENAANADVTSADASNDENNADKDASTPMGDNADNEKRS